MGELFNAAIQADGQGNQTIASRVRTLQDGRMQGNVVTQQLQGIEGVLDQCASRATARPELVAKKGLVGNNHMDAPESHAVAEESVSQPLHRVRCKMQQLQTPLPDFAVSPRALIGLVEGARRLIDVLEDHLEQVLTLQEWVRSWRGLQVFTIFPIPKAPRVTPASCHAAQALGNECKNECDE